MDKQTFLATLRSEHAQWEALLAEIGQARMSIPNIIGKWSIKDVIAHVTTWERWAANIVPAAVRGQKITSSEAFGVEISDEVDALDVDAFNEWIVEHSRAQSLDVVRAAARRAHEDLDAVVEALSEDDLTDSQRQFVGLEWKQDRPLWDLIANQSYLHYQPHAASIRKWLDELAQPG